MSLRKRYSLPVFLIMGLLAIASLFIVPSSVAHADTLATLCTYLNSNECIATQGTGNQVKLESSGATLIDFQPSTGTGNYKLKVYNSTHCLTYRTSDNAVTSTDCSPGDDNQRWHESVNGLRATFNIQGVNPIYLGNFDPPADGKNVWALPIEANYDYGWITP